MSTLFETCQKFDAISLPYVQTHDLGDKAMQWYIDTYGEFALHEIFYSLCLRDPQLIGSIARLFLTSGDDNDAYEDFAHSVGLTTDELDALFDPKTYRGQSA